MINSDGQTSKVVRSKKCQKKKYEKRNPYKILLHEYFGFQTKSHHPYLKCLSPLGDKQFF